MAAPVFEQLSLTTGGVSTLTIPAGYSVARIQAEGAGVKFTLDGSTPVTGANGHGEKLADGENRTLYGHLGSAKFIALSGTPKLNVHYFAGQ